MNSMIGVCISFFFITAVLFTSKIIAVKCNAEAARKPEATL